MCEQKWERANPHINEIVDNIPIDDLPIIESCGSYALLLDPCYPDIDWVFDRWHSEEGYLKKSIKSMHNGAEALKEFEKGDEWVQYL